MHFEPGEFYHIYNQGNNRKQIFFNEDNYSFFSKKSCQPVKTCVGNSFVLSHAQPFSFPNPANDNSIKERKAFGGKPIQELAYRVGILLSSYSQAINRQNKTIGSLFQQKTKSKILREISNGSWLSYFEQCFHYIHQNPLAAGLVNDLAAWPYSSYPDYAGIRNGTF